MAQRILVEAKASETIPLIEQLATTADTWQGRLQALWTLEGMGALETKVAETAWLSDGSDVVKAQALRLLEPLMKKDKTLQAHIGKEMIQVAEETSPTLALQLALSAVALAEEERLQVLGRIMNNYGEEALIRDAVLSSASGLEQSLLQDLLQGPNWRLTEGVKEICIELLATASFKAGQVADVEAMLAYVSRGLAAQQRYADVMLSALAVQAALSQDQPIQLNREPDLMQRQDDLTTSAQRRVTNLAKGLTWPGKPDEKVASVEEHELGPEDLKQFASGRQQYLSICAGCHGTDGQGIKRFGPPLVQSEWVLGDPRKLSLILLHGMEGPLEVNGKLYDAPDILPVMPSHSVVDDAHIAAILTYIRNEWGHQAGPVKRGLVGKTRVQSQGKVVPWKAEELQQLSME